MSGLYWNGKESLGLLANQIQEISRKLRQLQWSLDYQVSDSLISLEEYIIQLEFLVEDIKLAEHERLVGLGLGRRALCLFCGQGFVHGYPHACPSLTIRKSARP